MTGIEEKTMRKLLLMLFTPLLLTACDPRKDNPALLNDCDAGPAPGPPVNVHYGDSQLKVTPPIFTIPRKTKIKFNLLPDKKPATDPAGVDYDLVEVTIKSKDLYAHPWLQTSGTNDADGNLVVCVPSNATLGVMEYLIQVDEVGTLDPRAEVEN
jgi:hypothetical protein